MIEVVGLNLDFSKCSTGMDVENGYMMFYGRMQ